MVSRENNSGVIFISICHLIYNPLYNLLLAKLKSTVKKNRENKKKIILT